MSFKPFPLLAAVLGLFVAATVSGCVDGVPGNTARKCYRGDQEVCTGDSGCSGLRACTSQGAWGDCICSTPVIPALGGMCADDSACPVGAQCLLPTSTAWLGGGPPVGFCVADCTGDVSICDGFTNAVCVSADRAGTTDTPHAFCMLRCDLTAGTASSMPCGAVRFSACEPLDATNQGFCRPFCQFDADCPSGHCDRQLGTCSSEAASSTLGAFGSSCDPSSPTCDGVCLQLGANANICSSRCVFGTPGECATNDANPMAGVCAYPAAQANPGNLGYCSPLCNCNDDCKASGFVCQAFSTAATQTALQHVGMCVPSVDSAGAARSGTACSVQ